MPSRAHRLAWLSEIIPTLEGTGIVYCLTVNDAHRLAEWLRNEGIAAESYAADLSTDTKTRLEDRLLRNDLKVLCATSALGMGYDKPDLGFVIHYQSPGSPISYYQQVGRAGRAIPNAVGILLSGAEDSDIQEWFMQTAFPSRPEAETLIELLEKRADWTSLPAIEERVNLRRGRLQQMLKVLEVEGVVERNGMKYRRTLKKWTYPEERLAKINAARRIEQDAMLKYISSDICLMQILRGLLDDPESVPCGRCTRCVERPYSVDADRGTVGRARDFLRGRPLTFEPRKQYSGGSKIPENRRVEQGRALGVWNDGGWGSETREGKEAGEFSDALVASLVETVKAARLSPKPEWVTGIPSLRAPTLVLSLAQRVADGLGIPYVASIAKVRESQPQSTRANSAQQHSNVATSFEVAGEVPSGPVILIDDLVDSRWTMTVVGEALLEAGSGAVHPVVLAVTTPG